MPRYKRFGKTFGINISKSGISSSIKFGGRSINLGKLFGSSSNKNKPITQQTSNGITSEVQITEDKVFELYDRLKPFEQFVAEWIPKQVEELNVQVQAVTNTDEADLLIQRIRQYIIDLETKKTEVTPIKEEFQALLETQLQILPAQKDLIQKCLSMCDTLISTFDSNILSTGDEIRSIEHQLAEQALNR